MRVWPLAIGLQELVANRHKRHWSKAFVVSVVEKASTDVRCESERRTTVNCRSSVETTQTTSKPGSDVAPGAVWTIPVYGPHGVRHRGSVNLIWAPTLNCGNLRWQCKGKGTSAQHKADNTDVPPRDGATRSSVEVVVMTMERRSGAIQPNLSTNCFGRMNR